MSIFGQPLTPDTEDTEYYVYPTSDYQEHTAEHPFCADPTCPCHEDQEAIAKVNEAYQAGEVTAEEASSIVQGRTF